MPINSVIFDWGGVCCREGEPFASRHLQEAVGLTPEQIIERVRGTYLEYYRGAFDGSEFWRRIMGHFGLAESENLSRQAFQQAYFDSYRIHPEVFDKIRETKKAGKRVALLSNLTPEMRDRIRGMHGLSDLFHHEVYSCDPDVREIKPESKPYEVMLAKLGLPPQECLFIDNSRANVEAAERLGMQAMLFEDLPGFLRDYPDRLTSI